MSAHEPIIREYEGEGLGGSAGASCECGWSDPYLWGSVIGARQAYLDHVVRAHFPASWPGTFDIDYDPDGRTA